VLGLRIGVVGVGGKCVILSFGEAVGEPEVYV
jgi:hypothetical protein